MAILNQDIRRRMSEVMTPPKKPKAEQLNIRRVIDPMEVQFARTAFDEFCRMTKRRMAAEMAHYIAEKCGVIHLPDSFSSFERGGFVIEMELTINDASAYDQWLPNERRAGVREGREQLKRELPYGMEPEAFYE